MRRNRTTWAILLTSMALFALSGCGPSGNAAKLIGSWKLDAGPATVTVTYSKAHTYVATMAGLANGSETGEWSLKGDRLIQKAKSSTIDAENVGKEEPSTIVKLDDSVLIFTSRDKKGKEQAVTLQRVR